MIPLSSHNGYSFGFRWSLLGCIFALFYIASCDLIIPPDNSIPRYNTVRGEKRRPNLNPGGAQYQGTKTTETSRAAAYQVYGAPESSTNSAPIAQPSNQAVPTPQPVNTPTPQKLSNAEPVPAPPAQQKTFWSTLAFWRNDESLIIDAPASARIRPAENSSALQSAAVIPVARADLNYPDLHATPPKPTVSDIDNSRQRGLAVRSELEAGRIDADAERIQLLKDAVSEPSLLNNPPPPVVPAPAPARPSSMQLPPPPAMTHAQSQAAAKIVAPASAAVAAQLPSSARSQSEQFSNDISGTAFERLTQHSLDNAAVPHNPAPIAATAPEPIRLVAPPLLEAPRPVAAAPVPVDSAMNDTRGTIAPIHLVPPPSLEARTDLSSDAFANANNTTASEAAPAPLVLTSPRVLQEQNYLPGSRYADRRR